MKRVVKENGLSHQISLTSEQRLESSGTYFAIVRGAIDMAIEKGASDIHFEPTEQGFQIRLRVCGMLTLFFSTSNDERLKIKPEAIRNNILQALKTITKMPLGKQSEAQDERMSLPKRGIDIRVNKIPTVFGEKFVFRLFDKNKKQKLSDIGLNEQSLKSVKNALSKKAGLIIITGETGSGKTSTIYSMIEELDRKALNISTLENPVERFVEGVTHTSVSDKLSFAEGLRALLRQDPDVIVVGEIRDKTTATLAVRAASTGHLVLSTMHTNSALNIPKVFEYYGVDRYQLMNSLILGANQRLIRKICFSCSKKGVICKGGRRVSPEGCSHCDKGYLNERKLVFEYFDSVNEHKDIKLSQSIEMEVKKLVEKGEIDENETYRQAN